MASFVSIAAKLGVIAILVPGCVSTAPKPSGFLSDYSKLSAHAEKEGTLTYENPNAPLERYSKCIVDPIDICFGPSSRAVAVPGYAIGLAEKYLREEGVKRAGEHFQLTTKPGEGVLRLRAAVTILDAPTEVAQLSRGPGTIVTWPGSALLEMETVDSLSGQQICAYVNKSFLVGSERPNSEEIRKEIEARVARLDSVMRFLLTGD